MPPMLARLLKILTLILASAALAAQAQLDAPFTTSNRNPFVAVYGLPMAESASLSNKGHWRSNGQIDIASHFSEKDRSNSSPDGEAIFIDGETYRFNWQLRYGLSDRIELGLDIPWVSHQGGGLDSFIDGFHNLTGLPDGNRTEFARDQLIYRYRDNRQNVIDYTRSSQGLGDITLSMGYQLSEQPLRQWALRASLKLPTAEQDLFIGSDASDLALTLQLSDQHWQANYNLSAHASLGVLKLGDGLLLPNRSKDWVVFGSTTLAWQANKNLTFKLQLDAHTAFYNSQLDQLGKDSLQLTMGGSTRLTKHWLLDIGVVEDLVVGSAPDVVFHFALRKEAGI